MSKTSRTLAAFLGAFALASLAAAADQTPPPSRVTIKGHGAEVWIERSEKPARKRAFGGGAVSEVMGEAIRLKAGGADDVAVVKYLRAHRTELPDVIEATDARQLHKAGAGQAVMAYLATESAIDIGETGEGSGSHVAGYQPPAGSEISYGGAYGYPAGYGAVRGMRPPARFARQVVRRPVFPMPFRSMRSFPQ